MHKWERARRCGFVRQELQTGKRAVWSRNGVESAECPRPVISVQSIQWLQQFRGWKRSGGRIHEDMPVTLVEAYEVVAVEERRLSENGRRTDARTTNNE